MALSSKFQVVEMCLYLLAFHLMALPMSSSLELLSVPGLDPTSLDAASYIFFLLSANAARSAAVCVAILPSPLDL